MRWSLLILLSLLPLGGLAGKRRKLRSRQCKQSGTSASSTNTTKSAQTGKTYTLKDMYQGNSFLSNDWVFFSQPDPTHGLVNYVTKEEAIQKKLAVVDNGVAILSVDDTTKLGVGALRDSVRISSVKTYAQGLFVIDIKSMPTGCSTWPAVWTVGPDWPNDGEIDIIEGVNNNPTNQMTLHSSSNCAMPVAAQSLSSGKMHTVDCASSQSNNGGCSFIDSNPDSFGHGFNEVGGGVFATLWNETIISIWHFPRSSIPQDITSKKPKPSQWGVPVAAFPSTNCNFASHFVEHSVVIDTTLCGDWAGQAYGSSGCPGTCPEAVANPDNFQNAKWEINYIAIYD